ncbi:MAG: hypothetical protein ACOZBH_05420 [Patescibacteria group bacterium]
MPESVVSRKEFYKFAAAKAGDYGKTYEKNIAGAARKMKAAGITGGFY